MRICNIGGDEETLASLWLLCIVIFVPSLGYMLFLSPSSVEVDLGESYCHMCINMTTNQTYRCECVHDYDSAPREESYRDRIVSRLFVVGAYGFFGILMFSSTKKKVKK